MHLKIVRPANENSKIRLQITQKPTGNISTKHEAA